MVYQILVQMKDTKSDELISGIFDCTQKAREFQISKYKEGYTDYSWDQDHDIYKNMPFGAVWKSTLIKAPSDGKHTNYMLEHWGDYLD